MGAYSPSGPGGRSSNGGGDRLGCQVFVKRRASPVVLLAD